MLLDHEFPPDVRVENEMESLAAAGHEMHIACLTSKGRLGKEAVSGYIIHRKPISAFTYKTSVGALKFPFYFNFWRTFVKELMAEEKFDVIHVHDLPLAQVGWELKKMYNVKFVLDLHENWPAYLRGAKHTNTFLGKLLSSNKQWEDYQREMAGRADAVITVVKEMKDFLTGLHIPHQKIKIVSNTLKTETFKASPLLPDPAYTTLFYAGGIDHVRGLQIIIEGMAKLKKRMPGLRFRILGSGSYQQDLMNLTDSLQLQDNVEFLGWKSFNEVTELLAQSDFAVIPHLKSLHTDTTIPHKLFQYMYAQKPIIASNCTPIQRIIEETDTGITYTHDSPADFAQEFSALLENPARINDIKSKGKQAVLDKYNWNIDKKELLTIYT